MKNDEDNHQWWFAGDKGIYYVNVGNTTADLLRALYGVQELSDRIQFKPNKKRPKAPKLGFADSSLCPTPGVKSWLCCRMSQVLRA